jgi:hypothetical protein
MCRSIGTLTVERLGAAKAGYRVGSPTRIVGVRNNTPLTRKFRAVNGSAWPRVALQPASFRGNDCDRKGMRTATVSQPKRGPLW